VSERRTDDATLISALRVLSRTITTEDGVIPACLVEVANRLAELVEERRWIPVGERLPPDEVWVDVAGRWGDCLGGHDGEEWRNVEEDQFPGEVTHWRKRGPGPEVPNG
jgi:hypothetical protein